MRFVRYTAGTGFQLALVVGEELYALPGAGDLLPLLGMAGALAEAGRAARNRPAEVRPLEGTALLAPIALPPTVRDFYAFERHVAAGRRWRGLGMDPDWYQLPVFYFSNPYAIRGPGRVPIPPGCRAFDYELEVAAVLGGGGSDVPAERAGPLVAGYAIFNDWSARDLQQREMNLSLGPVKGKDSATGLGPLFVTADELADFREGQGFALSMSARVNGRHYSSARWSEVHYSFEEMIAYASRGTEVRPGDVLGSGTCGTGCIMELRQAYGEEAYPWLAPGDVVECEIEQLGTQRSVVAPTGERPSA